MNRPTPSNPTPQGSVRPAAAAGATAVRELPSPQEEAAAFWRMRVRLVRTLARQTFARARLRLSLVFMLSALLGLALFWLFVEGFLFVQNTIASPDVYIRTIRGAFGMFFLAMMVMLVFSAGIILYSSLFRARDAALLLTVPVRVERVFLHKFQEAILFSSWAFLLLASPMLLAYGIVVEAPWYYFLMLVPLLVAFTYIPAGLGAVCCLAIVYYLPNARLLVLAVCIAVVIAGMASMGWSFTSGSESDLLTPNWFQEMLGRLKITEHRLLPSWWLSSGLLQAAERQWADSVLFLALMVSNALFIRQLAVWAAARIYRPAYSRLQGKRSRRRRAGLAPIDWALLRLTPWLSAQMRLLLLKDLRLFRRDPVQWSQFLIFFGLLALYFVNIRRFSYDTYHVAWVNMVSFLNVYVVGLLLSTFTTRFIFPMISLEGRRFWILGLLPLRRETILWSKFLFAVGGSLLPCCLLILLSDLMLRVPLLILASHQLTCLLLCLGLAGIAVGLGAKMPSLREESPSRIAAGFGGTLNLVLSTLYILAVVLLTALPSHFYLGTQYSHAAGLLAGRFQLVAWVRFWLFAGTAGSILLGLLATVLPLRMGFRAFRQIEF